MNIFPLIQKPKVEKTNFCIKLNGDELLDVIHAITSCGNENVRLFVLMCGNALADYEKGGAK